MTVQTALVIGASGFLGSHVVRALVGQGRNVRIMVRSSSDTRATDDLPIDRVVGDISDVDALRRAMNGCSTVYYCVVDTRAWLRDPAPLYHTNVTCLQTVLDMALETAIERFVFTSTFATIGRNASGVSSESDGFDWWDEAPDYVRCRVQAEELLFRYQREKGLPAVACCVGNTYGSNDLQPTPHGQMIKDVATGAMSAVWDGGGPCVGIEDAATAMLWAADRGRVGERYIVAERWLDYDEMFAIAAARANREPPKRRIPLPIIYAMAWCADRVSSLTGKDNRFSVASLKCSRLLPNVDASKARKELGWQPRPVAEAIEDAVDYYLTHPR